MSDIVTYRLPARLAELNTFIMLASELENGAAAEVELKVQGVNYSISKGRLLLDVVADGAVVMARTLIQFLGINHVRKTGILDVMGWKPDDIKITDLNLPAVSPAAAVQGWPEGPQRAEQLLSLCFESGNKVSAHFTIETALTRNASIAELTKAFDLVIRLVNRSVYRPLQLPNVEFAVGGPHGHIIRTTSPQKPSV